MSNRVVLHAVVHGRVQGVFFRAFVARKAAELGVTGYVGNLPTGMDVEVLAEGDKDKLEGMIEYLKVGPPAATVEKVTTTWSKYAGKYTYFDVKN